MSPSAPSIVIYNSQKILITIVNLGVLRAPKVNMDQLEGFSGVNCTLRKRQYLLSYHQTYGTMEGLLSWNNGSKRRNCFYFSLRHMS